jgi:hypothetical protein
MYPRRPSNRLLQARVVREPDAVLAVVALLLALARAGLALAG